jgi:hypothetical protein
MPRIQCFMLEPTGRVRVSLRRYTNDKPCPLYPGKHSYHNDKQFFCEESAEKDEQGYGRNGLKPAPPHEDSHWPQRCACGYVFQEEDEWQRFTEDVYVRKDTGEETTISDAPAGAMWYAWWHDHWCTPQGKHALVVKTPGGEWVVDSQSSNCTMKEDVKQEKHHCWVLHGEPPNVTADKNGETCGAGAGSIQCGNYHGFLRDGFLVD